MTRTNIIAIAASLTTLAALASVPARAETISLEPLHGVSLKIGSEHAVGYFSSEKGTCNLVVARAGEPNWDESGSLEVNRFESSIPAGKSASYSGSVKFTCAADAQSMLIEHDVQVAASAAK